MKKTRRLSLLSLVFAFAGALATEGTTTSCGGGGPSGPACEPYDGGLPNVEAGEACRFPCPVASEGDDAGGDTYASFASGFFTTYCVRCHSTARTQNCSIAGSATCRFGAPSGYDWDDPASISAHLSQIRAAATVGDEITMPPDLPVTPNALKPAPPCGDRFRLARWIDSGAPGLP